MNPRRKLEKLLTVYVLSILVLFAIFVSFWLLYSKKKSISNDKLSVLKYSTSTIVAYFNYQFDEMMMTGMALNQSLAKRLESNEKPPPSLFDAKRLKRNSKGSIKIKELNTGLFIPNYTKLSKKVVSQYFFSKRVFQLFDPIYSTKFFNYYFISKEGLIRIVPPQWALSIEDDHDFNKDIFYSIATPENNPEKVPCWTDVYYDSIWKKWMTSLIIPIYDNEEFIGVTGSDIILDDLFKKTLKDHFQNSIFTTFVFNSKGKIIMHPDYGDELNPSNPEMNTVLQKQKPVSKLITKIVDRVLSKNTDSNEVIEIEDDGKKYFFIHHIVKHLGWNLCVYIDEPSLLGDYNYIIWGIVIISVIIALIIAYIIKLFFDRLILTRLNKLSKTVSEISSGNLDSQIGKIEQDELGFLEKGISHLQNSLIRKNKEIKRTHEELLINEAKYESYIEKSPYAIFIVDNQGYFIEVNNKVCELVGYSTDELLKMKVFEIAHPDKMALIGENFNKIKEKGKSKCELVVLNKAGKKKLWVVESVKLNEKKYLCFVNDITDQKENKMEIRELKERFELSLKINQSSVFIDNFKTGEMICTPELFLALGYNEAEVPVTIKGFLDLVQIDDAKKSMKAVEDYFSGKKSYYYSEFRLKTKAGVWKWVDGQGRITKYDEDGKPMELIGISRIIDDKKRAEEEIRKYKEHLEEMVLNRTEELETKNKELEKFNTLFVGREFRIKELKRKNKELKKLNAKLSSEEFNY